MTDLTSAAVPPIGPEDHVRGEGEAGLIVYADLGCPHCAAAWAEIAGAPGPDRLPPLPGRQQAPALAGPARGRRGRRAPRAEFFAMVDSLYADRGHVDDPHLWERAERLGLDLERFERDRRSPDLAAAGAARLPVRHPRRGRGHSGGIRCLYPCRS